MTAMQVTLFGGAIWVCGCTLITDMREPAFRHRVTVVEGTVWAFMQEGQAVDFGGPVGLLTNNNTYVVEVTPATLDLSDISANPPDPTAVATLIAAADQFCAETGYDRVNQGGGAGIWATEEATFLVRHCVPAGVELQDGANIGDDVAR